MDPRVWRAGVVTASALLTACGGSGSLTDAPTQDAGTPFPFDATVSCGATECGPGSVCVTSYEAIGAPEGPDDAGRCRDGSIDLGGACTPITYRCRMKPSDCTAAKAVTCGCTEICPADYCSCMWPPTSQQFVCECSLP